MLSSTDNSFVVMMLIVIIILAIAISLLANVLLGAAQYKAAQQKEEAGEPAVPSGTAGAGAVAATKSEAGAVPEGGAANRGGATANGMVTAGAALAMPAVNGLSDTAFYIVVSVIFLEMFVLLALLYNLRVLILVPKERKVVLEAVPAVPRISWWDRLNRFKPIGQEADLLLDHDYDGIRELDNRLPPWWLYGFYCTIIFACIYLWRYHVAHSAPLPAEEYTIAIREAEISKAEYLRKAANNVDENTVKLLTAPADLATGQAVFQSTCFACHGKNGEGIVGPNLTDDYWLHGGSINDVFRTIKYGYPEKGMKSWKDDYSAMQIAQIASYVKSLGGTHPANPKAPQGTPYKP